MPSKAALRWRILRRALLSDKDASEEEGIGTVSRVPRGNYGLVSCKTLDQLGTDAMWEYSFPGKEEKIILRQASQNVFKPNDHSICRELAIDNTGVVCVWPAEEVLTYYCLTHPEMFRHKRVIELGAGYGLAGIAVAVFTEAAQVVITDGNPKVVNYIEQNIQLNSHSFGETQTSASNLYWGRQEMEDPFDVIIAADCTYFRDFHGDLVHTIKQVLGTSKDSSALLFCPRRGTSLDDFVSIASDAGMEVSVDHDYDFKVSERHTACLNNPETWPNYDEEHNYPNRVSIS